MEVTVFGDGSVGLSPPHAASAAQTANKETTVRMSTLLAHEKRRHLRGLPPLNGNLERKACRMRPLALNPLRTKSMNEVL
jgi:hypothetical protein